MEDLGIKNLEIISGPKVLKLDDVSFGFFIWFGACWISLIAFIAEILVVFMVEIGRKLRDLLGLILFLRLFRDFVAGDQ